MGHNAAFLSCASVWAKIKGIMVRSRAYPPFLMQKTAWLRRGVLIFYALLLGLGLPFICWGTWADPSHAHAGPHWVFAAPPAVPAVDPVAAGAAPAHHPPRTGDDLPTGAARPFTAFMPFLPLSAPVGCWLHLPPRRGARLRQTFPTRSADLAIPTPPPRACA